MNTTYRSKKQVTRMVARCTQGVAKVYPRCSQALGRLMSMPRVSLEAAWSMARVCLQYAYSMLMTTFLRPFSSKRAELERRLLVSLFLMLILGSTSVWSDPINFNLPNGYYYLGNQAGDNGIPDYDGDDFTANFYMCPVYSTNVVPKNYLDGDKDKPLITSFKSFSDSNKNQGKTYSWAVWYIEAATGDNAGYFYIKHRDTEQYLIANDNSSPAANRRRINLGPKSKENDCLFRIQSDNNGGTYYISSKTKSASNNKYLNPSNGNKDYLYATSDNSDTGGIFGFYTTTTTNSAWHFVQVPCETPVITFDNTNHKVTISGVDGANFYYTLNNSDPSSGSTKYGEPFEVTGNTTIKAIAAKSGYVNSEIASVRIVLTPTITLAQTEYTYNGSSIEPEVTSVMDGTMPIDVNEYTVSYKDNTDAGTAHVNIEDNPGDNLIVYGSKDFTINPKALAITAEAKSKYYGDTDPELTYTSDGLVGNDAITGELSRETGETIGTYAINQNTLTAGNNYTITYTGANLTINKRALTITAKSKTITYGEEPANDGVTYNSFAPGEDESKLEGTLTYAYNYEQYGDVGSYTITPSGLTGANYNISFVAGTLTVGQKEVGLTWSEPTSFVYDGASHGLTATATNLVNGDEIGVTVTGDQTNAGNHTATVSALTGEKAGNYKLPNENTHAFTITPAALTITANNNTITYGDAPAGNGVTYSGFIGTEDESVLGGSLDYDFSYSQYDDAGNTYTITPKGLTSLNYDISFVAGTLTVNPKALTITANAMSKTYGDTDPVLTYTSVGLVNDDDITGELSREAGEDVGTYAITQGELTAGVNYIITYTGASFTITPKPLTITADSDTKAYDGTALTKNGFTYEGLLPSDHIDNVTVTGSQIIVGTSDNVPSAAVIKDPVNVDVTANYEITYINGTLTVTKKALSITADAKSKAYGNDDPALTYTSDGLVGTDAITGTLSRVAGEDVGTYAILQNTVTAGDNYEISFTSANLTITKVGLTITANNHTITYGAEPAGDGVTCEGFVKNDTYSSLGGELAYDYSYTQYDDVGNNYTIMPKGLTSENYVITFAPGTLTVNPKEVGLTWSETTSFTYDGEEHAPTATATGTVNGDKIGVIVTGAQTNAQTNVEEEDYYKATASALTGNKAGNYKLPEAKKKAFTITPKSIGTGTLASGYTFDFGENNTILLMDKDIGCEMVLDTDYSVSADSDNSPQYSQRTVTGKGNYTGSFDVRNVVISFTTDIDQEEWSATFAAENSDEFNIGIGLALPEGVSAFIISGIQGDWAIPEPLNYIPADVPVLLVANHQTQGFVVTEAESEKVTAITPDQKDKNMLEKVTEDTPGYNATTESVPFETKQIYLLYNNEFVFNKAGNLKKGKVFLNPNHITPSPSPAPARLMIAWNYTTGIEDGKWKMEDGSNERWYTLDGRCLSGKPTTKGLYIVNGKKIVIK